MLQKKDLRGQRPGKKKKDDNIKEHSKLTNAAKTKQQVGRSEVREALCEGTVTHGAVKPLQETRSNIKLSFKIQ